MKLTTKVGAYRHVLPKASRNPTDLLGRLARRPAIGFAVGAYEAALFLSERADAKLKGLAELKTASLVGCPF